MCLGDVLGFCLAPVVTVAKYTCGAAALGLVFTAGAVGIDLKGDWPIILIIVAAILGLIFCILAYLGSLEERQDEPIYMGK